MTYNVWDFIRVQRSEKSKADHLVKSLFTKAFNSICEQLKFSEFTSVDQLIKRQLDEEVEWLS